MFWYCPQTKPHFEICIMVFCVHHKPQWIDNSVCVFNPFFLAWAILALYKSSNELVLISVHITIFVCGAAADLLTDTINIRLPPANKTWGNKSFYGQVVILRLTLIARHRHTEEAYFCNARNDNCTHSITFNWKGQMHFWARERHH